MVHVILWSMDDCSLADSDKANILSNKLDAMDKLDELFQLIPNEETKSTLLSALSGLTSNSIFNTIESLEKTQGILEKTLKLTDARTTLSLSQRQDVSNVLGNFISYSKDTDCNCTSDFCLGLENRTKSYLEKVSSTALDTAFTNDSPEVISTDLFDVVTAKSSVCDLSSLTLGSGPDSASVTVTSQNSSPDCSQEVTIQTYTMASRDQLFNCNKTSSDSTTYKGEVVVVMKDAKTGTPITSGFDVAVTLQATGTCLSDCSQSIVSNKVVCQCPKLATFDVNQQLAFIFRGSDFGILLDLGNSLAALFNWAWQRSPVFWTGVSFTIWLTITLIVSKKKKLADYCIWKSYQQKKVKTRMATFMTTLVVNITSY